MSTELNLRKKHRCFNGEQFFYSHFSKLCNAPMNFAVYLPDGVKNPPFLIWLSGLTCTDENFITKAGAQRMASELGLALIAPDTSPRATGLAGEDDSYDLGSGAGFYVDATQSPWSSHYKMFSYVNIEVIDIIKNFSTNTSISISGHSMGGHGALISALKKPDLYKSVSAFSPICAPSLCPWGQKAFSTYLGSDQSKDYDAHFLIQETGLKVPCLIDQGLEDEFINSQLMPQKLMQLNQAQAISYREHPGYDHSYYFIASFMEAHLRFHREYL
jgi:S-formylglutathione hydrolase